MLKYTTSLVFLFPLVLGAQQPSNSVPVTTAPATSVQSPDLLSKDYRKSAIAAVSSIDDWKQKAMDITHSTTYSNGSVYVNRSYAEREADAAAKADKDVKTAKVDVTTPADTFLQQRLEIYLAAVTAVNYSFRHMGSEQPTKKVTDTVAACGALIAKALDEGSTTVFQKHPEMKCE